MTALLDIATKGMLDSARAVETIAQNVANVETEGYRAQRYDPSTGATWRGRACPSLPPARYSGRASASDVDLATEFVDLRRQQTTYDANATVIRIATA